MKSFLTMIDRDRILDAVADFGQWVGWLWGFLGYALLWAFLAFLLIAPWLRGSEPSPEPPHPFCGVYEMTHGGVLYLAGFDADGTYWAAQSNSLKYVGTWKVRGKVVYVEERWAGATLAGPMKWEARTDNKPHKTTVHFKRIR
jgi:hypothetical protein